MKAARLRSVLVISAAVYGLAGAAVAADRPPAPVTLVTASEPIVTFAQDPGEIAWSDLSGDCGSVRIETLATGKQHELVTDDGSTCDSGNSTIEELAVADGRAAWTLGWGSDTEVDTSIIEGSLVGHSAGDGDITLDDVSHVRDAANTDKGLGPENLHGEGMTFVWADPDNEDPEFGTTPPAVMRSINGHVTAVPGLGSYAATLLGLSGGMLAVTGATNPTSIEIRNVRTGALERTITLPQAPTALALSSLELAVVTGTTTPTITRYDPRSGKLLGTTKLTERVDSIAASGSIIAFATGRTIRMLDGVGRLSTLAVASARPIGLSVASTRVAWAEGRRVRAITFDD